MSDHLRELNKARTGAFKKNEQSEDFLEGFNRYLLKKEQQEYRPHPIEHPFIFVLGLPRSGTTLISQLIANSLDTGYINNLAARFYLAPLHGVRFARAVLGEKHATDYRSRYAHTDNLSDIHEFGYFWRHWLQKEKLGDVARAEEQEALIRWQDLKACLSTLQHEFGKAMVFKNIFGSYHMPKLRELLGKALFVYIERDELDVACSILDARRKYYGDNLDTWWSYAPPEVEQLQEEHYWKQIAGQVHYLKQYYYNEFEKLPEGSVVKIDYAELCRDPESVTRSIQQALHEQFDYELPLRKAPPRSFDFRSYDNRNQEKQKFESLLNDLRTHD